MGGGGGGGFSAATFSVLQATAAAAMQSEESRVPAVSAPPPTPISASVTAAASTTASTTTDAAQKPPTNASEGRLEGGSEEPTAVAQPAAVRSTLSPIQPQVRDNIIRAVEGSSGAKPFNEAAALTEVSELRTELAQAKDAQKEVDTRMRAERKSYQQHLSQQDAASQESQKVISRLKASEYMLSQQLKESEELRLGAFAAAQALAADIAPRHTRSVITVQIRSST